MQYLVPSFFPFLALAAIPTVLYILFRRWRRDVEWGAIYILRKTLRAKSRRNFWRQVFILALRTVFLALLVLAFARPYWVADPRSAGEGRFPHGPGTLHRVVLLDNSMSMSALDDSVSRMEQAKSVLREVMAGMLPGDTFDVVCLCPAAPGEDVLPTISLACPVAERSQWDALARMQLMSSAADMEKGLRKAKEIFAASPIVNKQLILLSDFTRKDYPAGVAGYAAFGDALSRMGVRIGALCLGKTHARNLAIESLEFGTDLLFKGQPTLLHVTVMNYSELPSHEGFLSVLVDGDVLAETSCVLLPNQRKTLSFPFVPSKASHHVAAKLGDDPYVADNRMERSVDVTEGLGILVVHRDESAIENVFERDTEFLRRMLRLPEGMMRGTDKVKEDEVDPIFEMMREWMGRSRAPAEQDSPAIEHKVGYAFAVGFEPATEVTPSSLRKKDLLFFSEVDRLSLTARQSLAAFVRQGGGIVIGVGPRVDPAVLNETFQELLPFPLAEPFRPPETSLDYERFLNIQTSDLSLPLFREFETSVNGNLADARVYNHYRLRLADAPDPGVAILSLSNGDPLLVQRRYGKGVVLLWTSTLGGAWNSLVVHQACMPLVLRLVNYGVSFRPLSRNVRVGDPLIHEVTSVDGRLFLTTPELKLMEAPRVKQGTREFIRFEETGRPGAYELEREGGEKVASFFVYSPDSESDLRPLTTKMERQLISTLKVQTGDTVDPGLPGTVRDLKRSLWQEGEGTEITTWAFLALFLLFAVDAALVRLWFS